MVAVAVTGNVQHQREQQIICRGNPVITDNDNNPMALTRLQLGAETSTTGTTIFSHWNFDDKHQHKVQHTNTVSVTGTTTTNTTKTSASIHKQHYCSLQTTLRQPIVPQTILLGPNLTANMTNMMISQIIQPIFPSLVIPTRMTDKLMCVGDG